MPVYRTCTLVCDHCPATTLGQLVGESDVLHPEGWQVDGGQASCPVCSLPPETNTCAPDELLQLLEDLVAWVDHPKTRGAFMMAAVHDDNVPESEAAAAQVLWDRARSIIKQRKETGP